MQYYEVLATELVENHLHGIWFMALFMNYDTILS